MAQMLCALKFTGMAVYLADCRVYFWPGAFGTAPHLNQCFKARGGNIIVKAGYDKLVLPTLAVTPRRFATPGIVLLKSVFWGF